MYIRLPTRIIGSNEEAMRLTWITDRLEALGTSKTDSNSDAPLGSECVTTVPLEFGNDVTAI